MACVTDISADQTTLLIHEVRPKYKEISCFWWFR